MKNILLIVATSALLCGCSFNQAQQKALITTAASTGSSIALMAKPEYRPAFQASSAVLGLLSQTNQLTAADIQAALMAVNVNGANTPIVALSINNALTLVNAFGAGIQNLPASNQLAALQGVTLALKTGIDQGIAVTAVNAPVIMPPNK